MPLERTNDKESIPPPPRPDRRGEVILAGGPGGEHEVSLRSAAAVLAALPERFAALLLAGRNLRWRLFDTDRLLDGLPNRTVSPDEHCEALAERLSGLSGELEREPGAAWSTPRAMEAMSGMRERTFFIAMHGAFGEDGTLQALLECCGLRYTGSGPAASAAAMDKWLTRAVAAGIGIPQARAMLLRRGERPLLRRIGEEGGISPPFVMKPRFGGSSVDTWLLDTEDALGELAERRRWNTEGLPCDYVVERVLPGREFSCGLLETEKGLQVLPLTEIKPLSSSFFDYTAKYAPGGAEEITPAPIERELAADMASHAVRLHERLGCRGMSRVDFKLDTDGTPALLEINTIPGLTPASILPKMAQAAGISYPGMIELLLESASRRR